MAAVAAVGTRISREERDGRGGSGDTAAAESVGMGQLTATAGEQIGEGGPRPWQRVWRWRRGVGEGSNDYSFGVVRGSARLLPRS